MTQLEYKLRQISRLLDEAKSIAIADSTWLTPDDQHAIERKIDELERCIEDRYKSHI